MRVLEVSEDSSAAYAGLLLGEMGADVIKVEPPGGDPQRYALSAEDMSFDYLHRRKRSVTIDLSRPPGRRLFRGLVAGADAIIEDVGAERGRALGLSYRRLMRANRDVVMASISGFGPGGPWSDWRSTEIVLQATGGVMASTGYADSAPQKLPGQMAHHIAGLNAALAVLAAVYGVRSGLESGVHIDVSAQETFAPHWARHISQYAYAGMLSRRAARGNGRQGFPDTVMAADGPLYMLALRAEWESLAFFLGLEQFITSEWSDAQVRAERWSEIEPHFRRSIAGKSRYEWFAGGAERGYTFAPLDNPLTITSSPQLQVRQFFEAAEATTGASVPCPGLPFPFADGHARSNRPPSPGEHNAEVFAGLRVNPDDLGRLHSQGVI